MPPLPRWQNAYRLLPFAAALAIVVLLACATGTLWPGGGADTSYVSHAGLELAFHRITVDRTTQPDLVRLGFDSSRPGVRSLSGLGVQEFFMPRSSRDFDRLDPAVRDCFDAEDRCTALVVPLGAPDKGGLFAAHAAGQSGQIVLLLRSGRVAYKEMRGE